MIKGMEIFKGLVIVMEKQEKERLAQEYYDKITEVNKENALNDMRTSIAFYITKNGKYESMIANQYRDKMIEYGVHCKEEELDNWMLLCQSMIDSICDMSDAGWLYGAWVMEATAKLLEALDSNDIDWDVIREIISEQGHTGGTMSAIGQLLIKYSPNGVEFVEHIIKTRASFDMMTALKCVYNEEKVKREEKEKIVQNELGTRLVKVLNERVNSLSN